MEMENIQMVQWKEESSAAAVPINPPVLLLNALFGAGGGGCQLNMKMLKFHRFLITVE